MTTESFVFIVSWDKIDKSFGQTPIIGILSADWLLVQIFIDFKNIYEVSWTHDWDHIVPSIGVRGVFLQRGGISQPSILLACFNSAGGVNAGLWNSLKGDVSLSCFGEGGNFVLTNLGPTILDRCTHEGMTFLWKTILSSKTLGIGKE